MGSKINIQARIQRHSRILKESLAEWVRGKTYYDYGYNIVLFVVIFLLPIYPVLASFVHNNWVVDFYRWDIDESSIIESYTWTDGENDSNGLIVESKDSFLSISTLLNDERDVSGSNEVIEYTVQSWDSISAIALRFGVSSNSILWANDMSSKSVLKVGKTIKVPPVSGLIHQVKSWETLSTIAKKYEIDAEKIRVQNGLWTNDPLLADTVIVIPWAIKKIETPKPVTSNKAYTKAPVKNTKTSSSKGYSFSQYAQSEDVNDSWIYELVKRKPKHTFYWWNCTWFVAQYKNVNWWWNAKDWLKNAKSAGHATGSEPSVWSIVVFNGKWYNPRYGHVGIVVDMSGNNIIVKDMNYRKINEVTTRKVPKSDRAIIWYIYVD